MLRTEDVVMRRRLAFWRACWRWAWRGIVLITLSWVVLVFFGHGLTWGRPHTAASHGAGERGDKREAAMIDALTLPNTLPAQYESLPDGDANPRARRLRPGR